MKVYWGVWALVTFVSFIVPETIALFTNVKNTLSWQVWNLESTRPGGGTQVGHWTAAHFLVGGVLIVLLLWLIGHLVFGLWA